MRKTGKSGRSASRVPPSGTWDRRRADLFALASDWIGPAPRIAKREATEELVRSYLRGFGPATPGEIRSWAGLPMEAINARTRKPEEEVVSDEERRHLELVAAIRESAR